MTHLRQAEIGAGVHYPVPIHQMPAYRSTALTPAALSNTECLVDEIVSLPMHPMLSESGVERVAAAVTDFYA
jgi:dTDP-4-amino-4,6-dideoxygalactose transaminase